MKNLNKVLLITASALAITTSSIAGTVNSNELPEIGGDIKMKLSAFIDFQAGLRKQNHLEGSEKNVSKNRKRFAFYNSSAMKVDISNKVNDIEYGGKIILVPTANRKGSPSYNGSHIYIESEFGRLEAGSPFSAASTMMIDGSSIAAGAFGNWSRYTDFTTEYLRQGKKMNPSFATSSDFFLDSKLTTKLDDRKYSSEPARSIAFYTPKFTLTDSTKVQVGVSYTPDSSNTGADKHDKHSSGVTTKAADIAANNSLTTKAIKRFEIDNTVKDAISGGICLEKNFSDGVDLKVAVSGEYGKSAGKIKAFETEESKDVTKELKLSNLRTYNIGAVLNVGNYSYAASFGSLGKSLTNKEFHKAGRKTSYYTGTVAYKQGPFTASASYYKTTQFKNTSNVVTIGTDYQLAPGFKPYAQISAFKLKGRPEFHNNLKKKKTRGTIALVGAKLSL